MLDVRQSLHSDPLRDPVAALDAGIARAGVMELIGKPAARVGVAVGSRHIDSLPPLVDRLFELLRSAGHRPFLLPAMGSHGGASARGQEEILRGLGLARAGREIEASMETVPLGKTPGGVEVFTARSAAEADAVIALNRISPHTGYTGDVQSGLVKMLAVGLGKERGAGAVHRHGFGAGSLLGEAADLIIGRLNVAAGVAVVEDGYKRLSKLEVIAGGRIRSREPELLEAAFSMFPRIPLSKVDLLIVDEMGKDVCGTGMHPVVTGRGKRPESRAEPLFECRMLVVLGLTPASAGNATGIGFADVTTERLLRAMDEEVTRRNVLTSGAPERARVPLVAEDDRRAVSVALQGLGDAPPGEAVVVRIKNTGLLSEMKVSTAAAGELEGREGIFLGDGAEEMAFGPDGSMLQGGAAGHGAAGHGAGVRRKGGAVIMDRDQH